jgi:hypothetical protein
MRATWEDGGGPWPWEVSFCLLRWWLMCSWGCVLVLNLNVFLSIVGFTSVCCVCSLWCIRVVLYTHATFLTRSQINWYLHSAVGVLLCPCMTFSQGIELASICSVWCVRALLYPHMTFPIGCCAPSLCTGCCFLFHVTLFLSYLGGGACSAYRSPWGDA